MQYEHINFISAEPLIAEVKQELKYYFEAGSISEVLIPTFVDQALRKLKVMVLKPEDVVLHFVNYKSELPCDFALLDRAMIYESDIEFSSGPTTLKGYYYMSTDCSYGDVCCDNKSEYFEQLWVATPGFRIIMRQPKWIRVYHGSKALCTENCPNLSVTSADVLKIENNKHVSSTFETGCVHVRYFSRPVDEFGIPMVPEILEVEEYIKAYLKFKFFEMMWNGVVDETFNQIQTKFQYYKQDQLAKLQAAFSYLLTKTKQQIADSVVKGRNKFVKYHIK